MLGQEQYWGQDSPGRQPLHPDVSSSTNILPIYFEVNPNQVLLVLLQQDLLYYALSIDMGQSQCLLGTVL